MLTGSARITAIDADGRNFVDDVGVGDLWYFPPGIPHSIQGLNPDGCEFLLVFDDGDFDEDNTFLLSDWFKHTPPVWHRRLGVRYWVLFHEVDRFWFAQDNYRQGVVFLWPIPLPTSDDRKTDWWKSQRANGARAELH